MPLPRAVGRLCLSRSAIVVCSVRSATFHVQAKMLTKLISEESNIRRYCCVLLPLSLLELVEVLRAAAVLSLELVEVLCTLLYELCMDYTTCYE